MLVLVLSLVPPAAASDTAPPALPVDCGLPTPIVVMQTQA
jgi:hypothetical protein